MRAWVTSARSAGTRHAALAGGCVLLPLAAVLAARLSGHGWPLVVAAAAVVLALRWAPGAAASVAACAALGAGVAAGVVASGDRTAAPWLAALFVAAVATGLLWRRELIRLRGQTVRARAHAEAVAVRDELTGCVNRRGLVLLGEQVLHAMRRRGDSAHAALVEVSGLAEVEQCCGPAGRDEVLVAVAEALRAGTRDSDVVARWTDQLFAVVGPGNGSVPGELERRVRVHLLDAPPVPMAAWPCRVTAGVGVLEPWDTGTLTDLLHRAEEDLGLRRLLRAPSAPEPPLRPGRDGAGAG